ncbi:MAG: EAL domain-containing protein [Lachnospiraceae bacterium]|nr:EAL domain-containing protein [Lachnospiraceae bacterium]
MGDKRQLTFDEIKEKFPDALKNGNIYVCYQAQINHVTGRLAGAEALMRWEDPDHGPQYPADFIPFLEQADLIFKADLFVFREVCALQNYCRNRNIPLVPISVNMSRYDIYNNNQYVEEIEKIRREYGIPVDMLRIEITESSAIGGTKLITSVLEHLHQIGYVVEMDDFGAGYSSLNILKDLNVDIIKLDMNFLNGEIGGRGGTIISSMVQMTKWLNTPVIAEGVETLEQADYMSSIGCYYIQGYLYSKPIKRTEFLELAGKYDHEPQYSGKGLLNDIDSGKFWNPDSMETLLFNNFVGPAAIFTYENGKIEFMRVNTKFVKEIGAEAVDKTALNIGLEQMDETGSKIYEQTIKKAIETREEEECETWIDVSSRCCGDDRLCIRSHMRLIGTAGDQYIFYVRIRNITAERLQYIYLEDNEKKFRMAIEQNNAFAWEYDIATKKMRPCSRCRRELGLPEVLENYPEPMIENGFFPAESADMYRRWHKELAEGKDHLEAIIPLTEDRIPFIVRYTAEFDEAGRPYKAYGSATEVKGYNMAWHKSNSSNNDKGK